MRIVVYSVYLTNSYLSLSVGMTESGLGGPFGFIIIIQSASQSHQQAGRYASSVKGSKRNDGCWHNVSSLQFNDSLLSRSADPFQLDRPSRTRVNLIRSRLP